MKIRTLLYFMLGLLCLSACSNRQIYESVQAGQRSECQRLPETQIDDCLARYEQTYEEYAREKEAIEKDGAQNQE